MKKLLFTLVIGSTLGGCALFMGPGSDQTSSIAVTQSAFKYLYPEKEAAQLRVADVARLDLPLRVGVGFIPSRAVDRLSAATGAEVIQGLVEQVQAQKFVERAIALPADSLTPSGGFGELDKVAFMHRLDAVLLLSYEQIAITEQSPLSLLDLTIVGAYVVPGHHNDVQTRLTATAVHIPSRRYLLSADGIHESTQESTLMHASAQIRNAMEEGMLGAAADLDPNLHLALASLRRDIAADRSFEVKGGGVSLLMTLCGMLLLGLRRCTVR